MEFKQAKRSYEEMSPKEREVFVANVTESMMFVEEEVQQVILDYFYRINDELGKNLEKSLTF